MGCCLSTATTAAATKTSKTNPNVVPPNHHQHLPVSDPNDRAPPPPPPCLEEETVKEVLSETPIPKQPIPMVTEEVKNEPTVVSKPTEEIFSEVSDFSEMCSFSESLSTVTDKREDDGEVTQRVKRPPARVPRKRPISGDFAGRKEKGIKSPARRSEPSPVKSRSVQGRTMTTTRCNVGPPNALRRDFGECSGRRSRSPVTRGEGGTRRSERYKSPTLASTGRFGGRTPAVVAKKGGEVAEKPNDGVSAETTESLENPLVSMECFIFL